MLTWQLILIQLVTFILIVLFLRWLLYSHISRALKKLHYLNKQNLAKEKALKEELDRAKKQARGELIRARKEAEVRGEKMRLKAEEEAEKILEQARKESERIIEEGKRESQRRIDGMMAKIKEKTAYLAVEIIRYTFSQKGQENLQTQLVGELQEEVKKVPREKLKLEGGSVEIITAFELSQKQKLEFNQMLSAKLGKEISLTNQVDKDIIAGIILKSGGFVVDGSLHNKLKKIFPLIRDEAQKP